MKFSALISVLFFSLISSALQPVQMGHVSYAGTGCLDGSLHAEVSVDGSQLSTVLFDQFQILTRKGVARATCSITIPLQIENGYQVAIGQIEELNGFAHLANSQSRLTIKHELFLAGQKGPRVIKTRTGKMSQNFSLKNALSADELLWSRCGESVLLRAQISALVVNQSQAVAAVSIDSVNLLGNGRLHVRRCE